MSLVVLSYGLFGGSGRVERESLKVKKGGDEEIIN